MSFDYGSETLIVASCIVWSDFICTIEWAEFRRELLLTWFVYEFLILELLTVINLVYGDCLWKLVKYILFEEILCQLYLQKNLDSYIRNLSYAINGAGSENGAVTWRI